MNRRRFLQASAVSAMTVFPGHTAHARFAQTPVASPEFTSPEEGPLDSRARDLIDRLQGTSALAVLEVLGTAEVIEPLLLDTAGGEAPTARPWHDTSDTDLEHALGGVLIVTNDEGTNSPELGMLGGYIVFESAHIAYDQLMHQMEGLEMSMRSTSAAGAKVWIIDESDMQLGVMRLGNVFIMGDLTKGHQVMEGLVMHLDAVTREIV